MNASPGGMDLLLEPAPPWNATADSGNEIRRATLESFGLDPCRPVVVVGHQPLFWHSGILAKFLAADALAQQCNGQLVHLVLDGHRGEFGCVRWPRTAEDGTISGVDWVYRHVEPDVPMGLHMACAPRDVPEESAAMLHSIRDALRTASDQTDAAWQHAAALNSLMDFAVGPRTTVMASDLAASPVGAELLDRMCNDADAGRAHYNSAAATRPHAGVAALESGELPLWTADEQARLHTARVDDPDGARRFPKALLLTAMARTGLADVFVHGTGGAGYDGMMEAWLGGWLDRCCCPMVVASASLHLPLGTREGWESIRRKRIAQVRRQRHDPSLLLGGGLSQDKTAMLEQIDAMPAKSSARREAYLTMHEQLSSHPAAGDGALTKAERNRLDRSVLAAASRTWPFPLFAKSEIESLRDAVHAGMR
ncbi:MAG: hypothetical protein P8L37_07805 [Phycisphaerales bacterium]|nr:hypothetical protein [Phycisphaerales bacterium]